ncbi:hypothetical protein [Planktothrix agardhii]|jgi:hypothetical protein|uniref:Nucleic acid binding OB-fold tRNA/helicase-type n=4 Tax=Planktothrix agardhii TaxID=1160 RepID=A0A1J1JDZ7_PLAAG|nr:hypothetical protein [Planktothrix agardhii]MCF3606225.1 hypothetical protein [Planktothrix agardhii 1033]BBD56101.1 hypothetical protein NIES204_34230 [Planktothrix agardhii NIES-204]MCB8750336.1 hypothetical protein [Planktothrix agardhii 1810]MCB8765152.1 hypothetical protein [Planktothrix agardhii 1809]MCB8778790.1 hypothetical protein [Planktothrix agardhii 1031]
MNLSFPQKLTKTWHISIVLLFVTGLVGCQSISHSESWINFNTAKIELLQQKQKIGAKVYLRGKVKSYAPFLGAGAYQLQDNTGSIWVFTTQPLPPLGQDLLIQGKVEYKSILIKEMKGKDIGDVYIKEIKREQRMGNG